MKRTASLAVAVLATIGLGACATPQTGRAPMGGGLGASERATLDRMLAGRSQMEGAALARAVAAAASNPLGSQKNPVRAELPQGQRAYLGNLRCANGRPPQFSRIGNVGTGVYGNFVDHYNVDCGAAAPGRVSIYMDMYHPGHVETRAAPGFTMSGEAPAPTV